MEASLFDRLGGSDGITTIARDLVEAHLANPRINTRFSNSDRDKLIKGAASFFISGTGGPACYEGKSMLDTHQGMNIDTEEFIAVLDDALQALAKNNIGQREQEEVLFILYSMKSEIVLI